MTIKRINKIKNFGIFKDFHWASSSVPDFKKYNLLYGWNYSGKTTLSRILRSFETQVEHPDYSGAEFEVEDDVGIKHKQTDLASLTNIRVFNQDFIKKNLKWFSNGEEHIEPIFLLGEKNVELQSQLDNKKAEAEQLKTVHAALKQTYEVGDEAVKQAESKCAKEIKQQLAIPDLDVRHLRAAITSLNDTIAQLSDEDCASALSSWRSADKMDGISLPNLPEIDTKSLFEQTKKIFSDVVSGKPIEKLKNNARLEKWVQEGVLLHKNEHECQFCNNQLADTRKTELAEHFSDDFKQFQDGLITMRKTIEEQKNTLNKFVSGLPDKARYYQELRPEYEDIKKQLDVESGQVITFLDWLLEQLNAKQSKPFEAIKLNQPNKIEFVLRVSFDKLVALSERHNQKTSNFEQARSAAKDKLIKHYTSDFLINENYKTRQSDIKNKKDEYATQEQKITALGEEIMGLEAQLSDALKGATKLNDYIKLLFQHDGIKIEVAENKFLLKRNGFPAENLSEGEKTAISFVYFITCLEDKNTNLSNAIIFIDDPVSSLDSNHLFNICAFIRSKLGDCGQLFISTHNLEFFNLLKDWMRSGHGIKKNQRSFYLVRRIQKQNTFESILETLPPELEKFKSEYHYLFSILKRFDDSQNANFDQLFQIPNITRRLLEAYLGFRIPDNPKPLKNLSLLIDNETEKNTVDKFVNEYSHNESTTRCLIFNDFSECSKVVKIVLKALETKDQQHYDALCKIVNDEYE